MVDAIPCEVLIPSTKCEGLGYPNHFLKSRGSGIRNNFIEYRTKQATLFAPRNIFLNCSLQIGQKIYSICSFSFSCSDTFYSKSIMKKRKIILFLKVYHICISQHFPNVKI